MVLIIKIRNDIRVSDDTSKIYFAPNYFEAQNQIEGIYDISTDSDLFNEFIETVFSTFYPTEAHSLYYLTDSIKIADILIAENTPKPYNTPTEISNIDSAKSENLLNYFGFVIEDKPSITQLKELNNLQEKGIITKHWLEGTPQKSFPEDPLASSTLTINKDYADGLQFMKLKKRGLGVTIIDFETRATNNLAILRKSVYLNQLLPKNNEIKSLLKEFVESDLTHQKQTLVTIFGKTPKGKIGLGIVNGIIPDAKLMVCSLDPRHGKEHFTIVRNLLIELKSKPIKNAILLFEFILPVTDKENNEHYPICIFDDIAGHLDDLTKVKNFIIVGGMGNRNKGKNFDEGDNFPWSLPNNFTYRSLEENKSLILVGATKKEKGKFIKDEMSNYSKYTDAFLYSDFYVGYTDDTNSKGHTTFKGTSAATAVATGIIAYLMGEAIKIRKTLTTEIVKKVFKTKFMPNYPDSPITETTLENLWLECQKELNPRPSQQQ